MAKKASGTTRKDERSKQPLASTSRPPSSDTVIISSELPALADCWYMHYASESLSGNSRHARPLMIVLRDPAQNNASFFDDCSERELLTEFFEALRAVPIRILVGWNISKRDEWGWGALSARSQALKIKAPDGIRLFDLSDYCWRTFGNDYAPHQPGGRFRRLSEMNNLPTKHWLAEEEPREFAAGHHGAVRRSLGDKVKCLEHIHRMILEGSLRVATQEAGDQSIDTQSSDEGEYRPASWFTKKIAGLLRHATSPKRKIKRVRKKRVDDTTLYSVDDARRWWGPDIKRV